MKNLLLFLALFGTFACFSQKMKFGVNAGANYSEIKGMEITNLNYSGKTAFTAGVSFEYFLTENFSLKANPAFERKSNKAKLRISSITPPQDYTVKIWNNLDFITLPVLLKYNFGKQKSFFVNGGPYIAYLLKAKHIRDSNHDPDGDFSVKSDNTDSFDRYDAGIAVGVGKAFKVNGSDITVEFRNTIGMKDINRYEWFYGKSFKTQTFSLIAGWPFDL